MLAEAYIENNEMRIINYPKDIFTGHHWKVNIEPIEQIDDDINNDDFISLMTNTPVCVTEDINFLSREAVNER